MAEAVKIGISGVQIDFKLRRNGAGAYELAHVALQGFVHLTSAALLADVIDTAGKRSLSQKSLERKQVGTVNGVAHHHFHSETFTNLTTEVVSNRNEEHHNAQKHQNQRGTDAGGHHAELSGIFPFGMFS